MSSLFLTYLDRFPPQNEERLCSLGEETSKLVHQNMLNLVCLFYAYAHSDAIYARLYQDLLVLISRYCQRVQ